MESLQSTQHEPDIAESDLSDVSEYDSAEEYLDNEGSDMIVEPADSTRATSVVTNAASATTNIKFRKSKNDTFETSGDLKVLSKLIARLPSQPKFPSQVDLDMSRYCIMTSDFNESGSLIALGISSGFVYVYQTNEATPQYACSDNQVYGMTVTCVKFVTFHSTEIIIASYSDEIGYVKYWQYSGQHCLSTIKENRRITGFALNADVSRLLTFGYPEAPGDVHSVMNVYDFHSKQLLRTLTPSDSLDVSDGHRSNVYAAKYHEMQKHMILSGGWDDVIQMWDERQTHSIGKIPGAKEKALGPHICGAALDIDSAHDHVLTGSWRDHESLQVWDINTRKLITNLPVKGEGLSTLHYYAAQWIGRTYLVAGGCSSRNGAVVMDRSSGNVIASLSNLQRGVYSIASNVKRGLLAITADHDAFICKIDRDIFN